MIPASDRVTIGDVEVVRLLDGTFRVDGGAMFGVVPRTLWAQRAAPDAENRIILALNGYLVRTPEATFLLDTGVGPDVGRRHAELYSFERAPGLVGLLEELGVAPEDVDFVVNSHLHFDHCGGNTARTAEGGWAPAFPRARYVAQRVEWEQALRPVERDRPSYAPARLRALAEGERLRLLDGDATIAPGVEAVVIAGHTAAHMGVRVNLRRPDARLPRRRRPDRGPRRSARHHELRPLSRRHLQQPRRRSWSGPSTRTGSWPSATISVIPSDRSAAPAGGSCSSLATRLAVRKKIDFSRACLYDGSS